jgi:hypothetical protein
VGFLQRSAATKVLVELVKSSDIWMLPAGKASFSVPEEFSTH